MREGQEITALTGLRGVAAVYVMVFHYMIGLPFSNVATTFLAHGYLAVDLFFVLSGFVMALNYGWMFQPGHPAASYAKFLGRRIARVYPLYFAATCIGCLLVALGFIEGPQSLALLPSFMLNLLMIQCWGLTESLDAPAWSISAEWAAYLLFPALLYPCLFARARIGWASALLCILMLALLTMVPQAWGHQPKLAALLDLHTSQAALPVLRCLPEFTLGLLALRMASTPLGLALSSSRWISNVVCLAVILLLSVPRTDLALVLLFPVLVISLTSDRHAAARVLACAPIKFMGKLSYSIYLTHDLMGGILSWTHRIVAEFGYRHAQSVAAVIAALMTFPCAYMAYRFIEVPGRRWLREAFEGRPARIGAEPSAP